MTRARAGALSRWASRFRGEARAKVGGLGAFRRRVHYDGAVKQRSSKGAGRPAAKRAAAAPPPPLLTMTREPVQPVRLYYSIPSRGLVEARLAALQCMSEVAEEGCWHWLFHGEAARVSIGVRYDDVPAEVRPLILGWLRFPRPGVMTLEALSSLRAVTAARFFGPVLGPEVVALRCRSINRFFSNTEGPGDALLALLDRDVTVIDPRFPEYRDKKRRTAMRSPEDLERAFAADLQRRFDEGEDVPLVEDLPLAPEEETSDFRDLSTLLGMRTVRAEERWRGNTHITLLHIIQQSVAEFLERERR